MGSLSVTWDDHYRAPFAPLVPGVTFVSADDPSALDAAVDSDTAAIVIEPIQGEGGVRPASPAIVAAIARACKRTGALLIATKSSRVRGAPARSCTAGRLASTPDLVALGKALGAGVPMGAAMVSGRVAEAISAGDHGTTYGGNLLACRAALTFLDVVDDGVGDNLRRVSAHLFERLRALAAASHRVVSTPCVAPVSSRARIERRRGGRRGRGARARRAHQSHVAERSIRLLPPYIATRAARGRSRARARRGDWPRVGDASCTCRMKESRR